MYFKDLSPYQYGRRQPDPTIVNVGWLSLKHPHEEGPVPAGFVGALRRLVSSPVNLYRGFHICEYCLGPPVTIRAGVPRFDLGTGIMGPGEIRVRGPGGFTYVAPILVHHHVQVHRYRPPRAFVDAVLAEP